LTLSIIIVNYNVKYFLEQCLYSVFKSALKSIDVIVVDNNSTDGSITYLKPLFPQVLFIENKNNPGFAKACNQGLAVAKGEYVLFLNPDTLIAEDTLATCLNFFGFTPSAGAVGVRMVDGSGQFLKESKRSFPGPLTSFFKLSGLTHVFPTSRLFARYYLGHLSASQNQEVDVLAGAFMMMPKRVLESVGSFDEAFFMYGEDVDLSYRIQKEGYKNYYLATTTIIHFKGESTSRGSLNYVRLFYSAMSLFVKKHFSGTKAGVFNAFIHAAIWARAGLSATGLVAKKLLQQKKAKGAAITTLLVGNQTEIDEAAAILQAASKTYISFLLTDEKAGVIDGICEEAKKAQQVVFCVGTLSYKTIFKIVEALGGQVAVLFHAAGSDSIVGSSFSNSSGMVVSAQQEAIK